MPYLHVDDESDWAEADDGDLSPDVTPRPAVGHLYEPAEGRFDPAALTGPAAVVYSVLAECGAVRFRGTYDGGHDEGFAHADAVWFGADDRQPAATVVATLVKAGLHPRLVEAAALPNASCYYNAGRVYAEATADRAVGMALEELARAMAEGLLGRGFGTGEYSLFGAFIADLQTGKVEDDPDVEIPRNMTLD